MIGRIAARATLVGVPETDAAAPTLRGSRCVCGRVSFPPEPLGCSACGACGADIAAIPLAAAGTLRSFALAPRQQRPGGDGPLIVGAVLLDDGPLVEVVIAAADTSGLAIGGRVCGRLVPIGTDADGQTLVDCQFEPEAPA